MIWADRRFKLGHGRAFALYVAAYTVGRVWIEYLRVDDAHHVLGLRLNDWTSIVVFLAAVAYLVISAKRRPGREEVVEPAAVADGRRRPSGGDAGAARKAARTAGRAKLRQSAPGRPRPEDGEPAEAAATAEAAGPRGRRRRQETGRHRSRGRTRRRPPRPSCGFRAALPQFAAGQRGKFGLPCWRGAAGVRAYLRACWGARAAAPAAPRRERVSRCPSSTAPSHRTSRTATTTPTAM